jgi:hypothetical protein
MARQISTLVGASTLSLVFASSPASAEFRLERQLALSPGQTLSVDARSASVTLTGDSSSGAIVTLTSARSDFDRRFDVEFDQQASGLTITIRRRDEWLWPWGEIADWLYRERTHLDVRVPHKTAASVSTSGGAIQVSALGGPVRLHTSGGSLHISDVEGDVKAKTSGGSIRMMHVRGDLTGDTSGGSIDVGDVNGAVRVDTSGGSIRVAGVTGDVHAKTSGGGVIVRGAGGRVEAYSSGGPVTVGFAVGNGSGGVLSSSGGSVHAELDPAVAVSIEAKSSGGGVRSDLSVTTSGYISSRSLHGELNGGGPLLRLRSSGGDVRISAASR